MSNPVTAVPPAPAAEVAAHYARRLAFETDCADVHAAIAAGEPGFVLLDVRGPALYAKGHIPGALNLPRGKMTPRCMAEWPDGTLFVVYCAGPHCNGTDKAALNLAGLGLPVKVMIGGITGWVDEGFSLTEGA
ncbi:rhodanese-like domain-containing protein [Methylobacterium terricola]|uniref:Rhodanese-like domain-containing protein n=1 Tax=Methylobacterium terricola TaxID=2583531 RepID=A0A5C4LIE8_9HYPH|nr:rhodanese-like domain-containing protein [Methylobacterium terricola]TNC14093.1 rhodanese-like domain-containing protein [Methylobacterium terricola]